MRAPLFVLALSAGLAGPAHAVVLTTYTSRAAFMARLASDGVPVVGESFEASAPSNAFDSTVIATARVTLESAPAIGVFDAPYQGAHATSGARFVAMGNSPSRLTFNFSVPRTHFGLTFTDYGDSGSGILRLFVAGAAPVNIVDTHRNDGEEYFFGVVADSAVPDLYVQATNSGDSWGVDDLVMGTIPTPGGLGVALLAGAVATRRRRAG